MLALANVVNLGGEEERWREGLAYMATEIHNSIMLACRIMGREVKDELFRKVEDVLRPSLAKREPETAIAEAALRAKAGL